MPSYTRRALSAIEACADSMNFSTHTHTGEKEKERGERERGGESHTRYVLYTESNIESLLVPIHQPIFEKPLALGVQPRCTVARDRAHVILVFDEKRSNLLHSSRTTAFEQQARFAFD